MNQQQTPVISVTELGKEFRDFWGRPRAKAVKGITFDVYPGEVIGLLGPNGSGKSTTVKMLLGLLYPTSGQIAVFGKSPRDVKTKEMIGYLPEETVLYKYLTANETLDFFGSLFNLSSADRKRRISQLLDMVGLSHAANRRVGEYSKGMARRIGIAQAMINDPDLLILDEPTSGLDPIGCREVKDLIIELKKRGKTILVTSHLLSDIEDVCDRVIILYGGKIRASGELSSLLQEENKTRIVTPELPAPVMEKVLSLLRDNLDGETFAVDHPRRSLEEFFLSVIQQAKSENIDTSGAAAGGKIAEYLSASDKVLSDLLQETSPAPVQKNIKNNDELSKADAILDALDNSPATTAATAVESLEEADEKLSKLLGKQG